MRLVINRATSPLQPSDGWIHIVPAGEVPHEEAGIVQVLDERALNNIMAAFNQDKATQGDKWPGLYGKPRTFYLRRKPGQRRARLVQNV